VHLLFSQTFTMRAIAICIVWFTLCNQPVSFHSGNADLMDDKVVDTTPPARIMDIEPPAGAKRIEAQGNAFSQWLRQLPLRKDNRVLLYSGEPKPDQSHHYAVIDISTGKKDLQQCADAIMRMRAEYFYSDKKYDSISFLSGKTVLRFTDYQQGYRYYLTGNRLLPKRTAAAQCSNRSCFMNFLETVFAFSGTYNLSDQMKTRAIKDMQLGDVFIKAGSPGHAMMVVDMAYDSTSRKKYYMLAQGFMPAQDIHIVLNPYQKKSPWYQLKENGDIITPGWRFTPAQLKHW